MEAVKNKDGSNSRRKKIKVTRSGNPFTHSVDYIAKKLIEKGDLDKTVFDNIQALIELRDSAIHFYNYSLKFNIRIQELGTATLHNYVLLYKKWFGKDLSQYNFYLMPLSFVRGEGSREILLLNTEEKNFFRYIQQLEDGSPRTNEYSIALNIDVRFSKTTSKDDISVILSQDQDAIKVALSDDQIRERYPLDYQMLTKRCRERYLDFVLNNDYHRVRKIYETDLRYAYARYLDPAKKTSGKKIFYSEAILSQLDKHYTKR